MMWDMWDKSSRVRTRYLDRGREGCMVVFMKTRAKTQETGMFGDNGEGGWWAVRWSYDGLQGEGAGLTEREALKAAEADIENQREAKRWTGRAVGVGDHPGLAGMPSLF
jgi:hypothetical protein